MALSKLVAELWVCLCHPPAASLAASRVAERLRGKQAALCSRSGLLTLQNQPRLQSHLLLLKSVLNLAFIRHERVVCV